MYSNAVLSVHRYIILIRRINSKKGVEGVQIAFINAYLMDAPCPYIRGMCLLNHPPAIFPLVSNPPL